MDALHGTSQHSRIQAGVQDKAVPHDRRTLTGTGAVQDKAGGGLIASNLHPGVWNALAEAPIWEKLGRPIPALAGDLVKQKERLQLLAAQTHALTRSYNKASSQPLSCPSRLHDPSVG